MKRENELSAKYFVLAAALLVVPLISCSKTEAPMTPIEKPAQTMASGAEAKSAPVTVLPAPATETKPAEPAKE